MKKSFQHPDLNLRMPNELSFGAQMGVIMENRLSQEIMLDFITQLDGMAVLDQEGRYTYVSPAWESYTGLSAKDALGHKVWEVIPETHATEVFQTGKPVSCALVSKNGTPAFTTYYPRLDKQGKVCGVMLYIVLRGRENSVDDFQKHIDALTSQVDYYRKELAKERGAKYTLHNIVGQSIAVARLKEQIVQAAGSSSTVLIDGETGCGKELVARAIHTLSLRSSGNFVRVNCSAIPSELMESEFFGYEAGAFTGASRKGKLGRFALADGGSIFLDEVNLLPSTMQPKFLRVLQEREIDPVGGTKSVPVDVRVIAASNVNLEQLADRGDFRRDLYYRLNVLHITVPPLRERREDIPLLAHDLINRLNRQLGMVVESISDQALTLLMSYDWPGNVRELQNAIESAMNQTKSSILQEEHFTDIAARCRTLHATADAVSRSAYNLAVEKRAFEKRLIEEALNAVGGNRKEAAQLLGISRVMLYNKLDQYNISH